MRKATGTVVWFSEARGCGFISPSKGGSDVSVERGDVLEGAVLAVGSPVEYAIRRDGHAVRATRVGHAA
jgi:cold shock CspA family protein